MHPSQTNGPASDSVDCYLRELMIAARRWPLSGVRMRIGDDGTPTRHPIRLDDGPAESRWSKYKGPSPRMLFPWALQHLRSSDTPAVRRHTATLLVSVNVPSFSPGPHTALRHASGSCGRHTPFLCCARHGARAASYAQTVRTAKRVHVGLQGDQQRRLVRIRGALSG